jgi:hypothetical protein
MRQDWPISESYRSALRTALIFSVVIAIISALVIDNGDTAKLSGIGLAVFWGTVAVIISRRPQTPTSFDLCAIRSGCLPLVVGFQIAIRFVWHWRGLM